MRLLAVPSAAPRVVGVKGGGSAFSPAVVSIISVLGSAFLVVSYYRIFAKLCTRWQTRRAAEMDLDSQLNGNDTDANISPLHAHGLHESLIKRIPIFEYKQSDGFTVETECPVCIMEFVDKQELRMLPKCAHAFHVSCIDTWLNSNSTCPLCRANIFTEQAMNQYLYPTPLSPSHLHFFDTPPEGEFSPADYSMGDFARLNNGHDRSPGRTLRGLLNFEDNLQPAPVMWVPNDSESGRPEVPRDDSLRLYYAQDYCGDSSARHHELVIPASGSLAGSVPSAPPSTDHPPPQGPQEGDLVTHTASFKEGRDRDHRWQIHPSRRSWSRRSPFAGVRSFSMGTSRRLANALEFLDLEGMRGSSSNQFKGGDKMFSPYEYGITETPEYHHPLSSNVTGSPAGFPFPAGGDQDNEMVATGGSSSQTSEPLRSLSSLLDTTHSGRPVDSSGAAIKTSSGRVKGRSLSFRSPFSIKRSLSGGRNTFSHKYSGKNKSVYYT